MGSINSWSPSTILSSFSVTAIAKADSWGWGTQHSLYCLKFKVSVKYCIFELLQGKNLISLLFLFTLLGKLDI